MDLGDYILYRNTERNFEVRSILVNFRRIVFSRYIVIIIHAFQRAKG